MDLQDLHSFAVLVHRESPYLEACIQSLLSQTVRSTVYLSTSTPSEYASRIAEKYGLELYADRGRDIASDWNNAVSLCKTKYLTLAHQDDIYYPEYAEKMVRAMDKDGKNLIAFCDYEEAVSGTTRSGTGFLTIKRLLLWPYLFGQKLKSGFAKKLILRFGSPICCPSVIYNLEKCRPDFDPDYVNALDWDAWLRLSACKGSFVYVKDTLLAHRIHEDSETTRQISSDGRGREDLKMFKRLWPGPIAGLLARFYRNGYKSNNLRG